MDRIVYREIASIVDALHRCEKTPDHPWIDKHSDRLRWIEDNLLPSGSGIDGGTKILEAESTGDKIVLSMSYHHMDENGMYDGWSEHTIIVRPSMIHGITMRITGRDRNDTKEYLYEVYDTVLRETFEYPEDKAAAV